MNENTVTHFSNNTNQYISAVIANLIFMTHGSMIGWISPATPFLMSDKTPLKSGPMTHEQLSWIGSMTPLSSILSNITFGMIALLLGPKRTILFLAVPSIAFYVLVFFGDTYYHLLAARFCVGLTAGGIQVAVILYIADIANNNIRGKLGTFSPLTRNTGLLIGYIIGSVVEYKTVPCIFIFIPILFAISFSFLPNTPQYHLKKGDLSKAEKSLKFYKGIKDDKSVDHALFLAEFERLKSLANEQKVEENVKLSDFLNRTALKAMLNGFILGGLGYLSGYLIFTTYAVVIFQEAGATTIDPYVSSIVLAVLQLVGNFCSSRLSDTLGRKALLIISLSGSALGMLTFAVYSYLKASGKDKIAFEWVPVVSLAFVIFIACAGVVPLMFLMLVEHIPAKIRTGGVMICNTGMNIINFALLKLFPILMKSIGLHGCMTILAMFCTTGFIYVFIVVKETKGISLDTKKENTTETTEL